MKKHVNLLSAASHKGTKEWIEVISQDDKDVIIQSRLVEAAIITHPDFEQSGTTGSSHEGKPPFFLIEQHVPKTYATFKVVSGLEGVAEYLKSIKREKLRHDRIESLCTKDIEFCIAGDYCIVSPVGEKFLNPCPGWDFTGLMPHDHVDNDFLDWFDKKGMRFLKKRLSEDPVDYRKRMLKMDWWMDRIAAYKEWIAKPYPLIGV